MCALYKSTMIGVPVKIKGGTLEENTMKGALVQYKGWMH